MTSKISDWTTAKQTVDAWKAAGQTVVFTNGSFDILHAGHVQYLQEARALGDALVIGLNSDTSVKAYKDPKRPIVNQENRAAVLAALGCVDLVVPFDETTPISLISHLEPTIHVKGGDYTLEQLPEYPIIKAYGGKVELLSFKPGCSTTSIINKILDTYSH